MHRSIPHLQKYARNGLFFLSVVITLLPLLGLAYAEPFHLAMLELGERAWDEYYTLRQIPEEPSCPRRGEAASGDSPQTVRPVCSNQWEVYERIQEMRTPALVVFSALDRGVQAALIAWGEHRRSLWAFLGVMLMCISTLQRRYISVAPIRTRVDHQVQMATMVLFNALLTYSAITYQLEAMDRTARASGPEQASLNWTWIVAFGALATISLVRFFRPPGDLQSEGSAVKAILAVPVFSLLCVLVVLYAKNHGDGHFYHGFNVLLGVFEELSDGITRFVLGIWFYIWLAHQIIASRPPVASNNTMVDGSWPS